MAIQKIAVSADEFVRSVIDRGERDFTGYDMSGLVLATLSGSRREELHPRYHELNDYLKLHLKPDQCLILRNVYAKGFQGVGLWIPYTQAGDADFSGSDFRDTTLFRGNYSGANFTQANLRRAAANHANFTGAKLIMAGCADAVFNDSVLKGVDASGCNLSGAGLQTTDLREANFGQAGKQANFRGADLFRADIRGVKNLGKARYLGLAILESVIATDAEKAIIEAAIKSAEANRYDVSGEEREYDTG